MEEENIIYRARLNVYMLLFPAFWTLLPLIALLFIKEHYDKNFLKLLEGLMPSIMKLNFHLDIKSIVWVLIFLFLFYIFIISFFSFVRNFERYFATNIYVTSSRIVLHFGLVNKLSLELALDKVYETGVYQNIMGRIFNYGIIVIKVFGADSVPIYGIHDPTGFIKVIEGSYKGVKE